MLEETIQGEERRIWKQRPSGQLIYIRLPRLDKGVQVLNATRLADSVRAFTATSDNVPSDSLTVFVLWGDRCTRSVRPRVRMCSRDSLKCCPRGTQSPLTYTYNSILQCSPSLGSPVASSSGLSSAPSARRQKAPSWSWLVGLTLRQFRLKRHTLELLRTCLSSQYMRQCRSMSTIHGSRAVGLPTLTGQVDMPIWPSGGHAVDMEVTRVTAHPASYLASYDVYSKSVSGWLTNDNLALVLVIGGLIVLLAALVYLVCISSRRCPRRTVRCP